MELVETLAQLSSVIGGLGRQLGAMSRSVSELDKSTKTLKSTQSEFTNTLTATAKRVRENQPLTTGNVNPKQNATDEALLREAALLRQIRENHEKANRLLNGSGDADETDRDRKIDALLKGQEVIAGHLNNNPYLSKINELHKSVIEARDAKRKGSIATKIENFGAGSGNPLGRFIGGIGGTINSVRSAGVTLGNAGSYWFGGGRQAKKAEKGLEQNRRDNNRDTPLLNAYASRQMEINNLLKSKNLSAGERKRLTYELDDVRQKHGAIHNRIEARSREMASQTMTSLSYNERRLNPKQYKSYSKDEQQYINAHLQKNINSSFGLNKKKGGSDARVSLYDVLDIPEQMRGDTFGSKIIAAKNKSGNRALTNAAKNKSGNRALTNSGELIGDMKKLHDLRAMYKTREANGAKSTDPIMQKLMTEITSLKQSINPKGAKVLTGVNGKSGDATQPKATTFGDKAKLASDKAREKKKNIVREKLTGSAERPVTLGDHIISISESMRSVKHKLFSYASSTKDKMSGGMGLGGFMKTALAGAVIAAVIQKTLSVLHIGDASAGGSVGDDVVMKGGRALVNKGARAAFTKIGKTGSLKGAARLAKTAGMKTGAKAGANVIGKTVLKGAVKKIPVLGAGAGLLFAGQRAVKGDFVGAGMEALSGVASLIPVVGTVVSVGLDAVLIARDMSKNADKDRKANQARIDREYSEKYGFKSSVSKKGNIELSASRLNKKYTEAQQREMYAKLSARMYAEEMLNGKGRNIAVRDAGIHAHALTTSMAG